MPDDTSTDDRSSPITIEDAQVAAEAGGDDDAAAEIPDTVHVEFSHAVLPDGSGGGDDDGEAHPDGWQIDGTLAEVEAVSEADLGGDDDDETPGSRTLALDLSMAITADEEPTVSYDPEVGSVETATGIEPQPAEEVPVSPGPPPRPTGATIPADAPDEVHVAFDGPVESRTQDASMFTVGDGGDDDDAAGPELTGDIEVDDEEVVLQLRTEVDREPADGDDDDAGGLVVEYGADGDDDEASMQNLVGDDGAIVTEFEEEIDHELAGAIDFREARVPAAGGTGDDGAERDRVEVWFEPPMSAETAAGYELEGTLARIEGIEAGDDDDEGGAGPHVTLDLHMPIDSDEEATLTYDPEIGDTRTAGGEAPDEEITINVETTNMEPTALDATLSEDGEEISVEFNKEVESRTGDASGFTFESGEDEGPEIAGLVSDGEEVVLALDRPFELDPAADDDAVPTIEYGMDDDGGDTPNLVDAEDGVVVEEFTVEIDAEADLAFAVEFARIPDDQRDVVEVRFTKPLDEESAAGFELDDTYARIEEIAEAEVDDAYEEQTLALGLHVEARTAEATLVYDDDEGSIRSREGEDLDAFEETVDALPPAPTIERAVVDEDATGEVAVEYDREVVLHQGDATGFELSFESDEEDLPELTEQAVADGDTVSLQVDPEIAATHRPTLRYEGDDDDPNVLGAEDGVIAAAEERLVTVEADTGGVELVDATVPREAADRVDLTYSEPVEAEDAAGFELDGTLAEVEGLDDGDDAGETLSLSLHIEVTGDEEPTLSYDADAGTVESERGQPAEDVDEMPVSTAGGAPAPEEAYVADDARDELRVAFDGDVVSRSGDAGGFSVEDEAEEAVALDGTIEETDEGVALGLDDEATVDTEITVDYDEPDDETNLVGAESGAVVEAFSLDADNRIEPADAPEATDATGDEEADLVEVTFDQDVELEQEDAAGFSLTLAESDADLSGDATVHGDAVELLVDGDLEGDGQIEYAGGEDNVVNADGVEAEAFRMAI